MLQVQLTPLLWVLVGLQVTEPVAGNYYPITAAAAVTDGCLILGVVTDRCGQPTGQFRSD
jgi:hypothetical protein